MKWIQPTLKVKGNSIISTKNNKIRNKEVRLQIRDHLRWKKKEESLEEDGLLLKRFFSLKRTYAEYISAIKYQNTLKEIILKATLYNFFRRMS
jgi:hypothetical protein